MILSINNSAQFWIIIYFFLGHKLITVRIKCSTDSTTGTHYDLVEKLHLFVIQLNLYFWEHLWSASASSFKHHSVKWYYYYKQ